MNLVGVEEQRGIKVGTGATAAHQLGDPPGDNHEQGQRAFEFLDRTQLQRLDAAGVFQHAQHRLFRRASPKSSGSNSVAAQRVDAVANWFIQGTRIGAKTDKFTRAAATH